jgi:3-isopropylmalate dehydrogenase
VTGGLGMAPAANIGDNFALFEPVHGAAFDIAGKQAANPSSFILSAKMMFEWLGMKKNDQKCFSVAKKIESAVFSVVKDGMKTKDIGGNLTTSEFTQHVISHII